MHLNDALNIEDLRRMAKRRLPKILFELIESGVEDEYGVERNLQEFRRFQFLPRYLGDIVSRDQTATLFGTAYSSPFGIAPTGFAGLLRHGADTLLARTAVEAGIPYVLSGAGSASIESLAELSRHKIWCHLYPAKERAITDAIVRRIERAGVSTLVITVDNPVYPNRERDTRNGFSLPLRLRAAVLLEALAHPFWIADYLRNGGMPMMDMWKANAPAGSNAEQVATFFRSQSPSILQWADVETLRAQWPGKLVLKGIQHPDDAVRARNLGVDGVWVSNHGAKSFDPLPSPLSTLPLIRQAVGPDFPLMMDGGVRRGYHVLVALCLGADFVFVGRPTLYGVAAAGKAGAERAVRILRDEIDKSMALIGCGRLTELNGGFLLKSAT